MDRVVYEKLKLNSRKTCLYSFILHVSKAQTQVAIKKINNMINKFICYINYFKLCINNLSIIKIWCNLKKKN